MRLITRHLSTKCQFFTEGAWTLRNLFCTRLLYREGINLSPSVQVLHQKESPALPPLQHYLLLPRSKGCPVYQTLSFAKGVDNHMGRISQIAAVRSHTSFRVVNSLKTLLLALLPSNTASCHRTEDGLVPIL